LPLLEGVKLLRWSFWNPAEENFQDEWPEGRPLPEIFRLNMTLDTGEEIDAIFRPQRLVNRGDPSGLSDDDEVPQNEENSPPQGGGRNPNSPIEVEVPRVQ
jgi:hypothetical protein